MNLNREYLREQASKGDTTPTLSPDMVPGAPDSLWLTIMSWRLLRQGTLVMLEFREYPGRIIWVGGHGAHAAREALYLGAQVGDSPDRWTGARVRLEKVKRHDSRNNRDVLKYVVAPPDENTEAAAASVEPAPPPRPKRRLRNRKGGT